MLPDVDDFLTTNKILKIFCSTPMGFETPKMSNGHHFSLLSSLVKQLTLKSVIIVIIITIITIIIIIIIITTVTRDQPALIGDVVSSVGKDRGEGELM